METERHARTWLIDKDQTDAARCIYGFHSAKKKTLSLSLFVIIIVAFGKAPLAQQNEIV